MSIINLVIKYIILLVIFVSIIDCNNFSNNKLDSNKYIDWSVQPIDTLIEREFNKETRLFYLCKTWGFVKYFHPNVRNGKVDWDNILIKYISDIEECNSIFEFSQYIESMLNNAGGFEVLDLNNINEQKGNNNIKYWFYDSAFFSKRICEELSLLLQLKFDDRECHYTKQRKSGALIFNEKQILKDTLTKEERFLSLFRYWNIIEYFYPYKYLLDRNWNEVLLEYIPIINASDEPIEYHKSIIRLTSEITDAHAETTSKIIDDKFLGNYIANFRVFNINDTLIVHKIRFQEINDNKIKVGDIILRLNDEDLLKKQIELKKYYKSSNEQRLKRELNALSLSSENEINKLEILRNDSLINIDVNFFPLNEIGLLKRKYINTYKNEITAKIYNNIGYIDISLVTKKNWEKNYRIVKSTDYLILDFRTYPDNSFLDVCYTLLPDTATFFRYTYSDLSFPGRFKKQKGYLVGKINNENYYKGKLILLVNEYTQSHSEFFVMALLNHPNSIIVGSRTAGSDGNVAHISLPGGINTYITSIGIYFPDDTETQRIGLPINKVIKPTINGIISKKDDVLNRVLNYCTNKDI